MREDIFWHTEAQMWWPKDDHNPKTAFEWVCKYLPDVDHVTKLSKQRRTVVQAGGHVGLWPIRLARHFDKVLTFEIQPSLQECLVLNCAKISNLNVYCSGLGAEIEKDVKVRRSGSAGGWRVDPAGDRVTKLTTIDYLELKHCDAIVLDIEGFEVEALTGALETIKKCKPLLYVEELPRSKTAIKSFMKEHNYKPVMQVHRDMIYVSV